MSSFFHTYIIPYCIHANKKVEVLLARKKTFNRKDGFIHNNPGQLVFVGGYANPNTALLDTMRNFEKETGFKIKDLNNVHRIVKTPKYTIFAYRLDSPRPFDRNTGYHRKQIQYLRWVDIDTARLLLSNGFELNPPCNGDVRNTAKDYLNSMYQFPKIPEYEFYGFQAHLAQYDIYITNQEKFHILECFMEKDEVIDFIPHSMFDKVLQYIELYMFKRSKIDWFACGIQTLCNNLRSI